MEKIKGTFFRVRKTFLAFGFSLFNGRMRSNYKLINIQVLLSNGNVTQSILAPSFSPRVLDNPILFTLFSLVPSNDLQGVTRVELRGTFDGLIDTIFVDQEVSVDRDDSNDWTILVDFSLNTFFARGDAVVSGKVFITGVQGGWANDLSVTGERQTAFVNQALFLSVIKD